MKLPNLLVSISSFLIVISTTNIEAQINKKSVIRVKKTKNFNLDGKGHSEAWSKTKWISLPLRKDYNTSNKYRTKFKTLYSKTGLYFLFSNQDSILNATMDADFMKLWKEDVVEVFLWPDEKIRAYFEYELSPLNYELPLLVSNINGKLTRWIPYMYGNIRQTRHKTSVKGGVKKSGTTIKGWMAEFFIPFKLLRPLQNISPEEGTRWKANFYRVDYDDGQHSYLWQPVSDSFHQIDGFGTLIFQ